MTLDDLGMIFKFVGGLGLFLYGMHIMADGLQKQTCGDPRRRRDYGHHTEQFCHYGYGSGLC